MDKKNAAPKHNIKEKITHATNTNAQNKRLLNALEELKGSGLNSHQVRYELDIYCPTARITDLRKMGYDIRTIRETIDTGKGKHSIARWVLINKAKQVAA
jgi:hypothetical protein